MSSPLSPSGESPDAAKASFVAAVRAHDLHRAEAAARYLLAGGLALVDLYELLTRALQELGEQWAAGAVCVADEHQVSAAVRELVARLRASPVRRGRGRVLLVTAEGERHVLGLYAFAHVLEERGFDVTVGGELPWREIMALAVGMEGLVAIGLGVHVVPDVEALRTAIAGLRAAVPKTAILLGGPALQQAPDLARLVGAHRGAVGPAEGIALIESATNPLSPRERQVVVGVADGLTNGEIADRLGVGAATVKAHLDQAFVKLGVTTRAAAVATAMRRGWLEREA